MNRSFIRHLVGCIAATFFLLMVSNPPSSAEQLYKPVRIIKATIVEKAENTFYVGEKKFIVSTKSVIRDYLNNRMSFSQLKVPVRAQIKYKILNSNENLCLRIKILSSMKKNSGNPESGL